MSFTTSYDSMAKVVSAIVCGTLLIVALATKSPIAAGLGIFLLIICYAWAPRGYLVEGRSIQVKRLIGSAVVPLDSIREARPASTGDLSGALRLFGSGGLFGYYGLFQTAKLGKSTWYVTNQDKAVVVITETKTAVFSPDDVDGFLAAIRSSVPVPVSAPAEPPVYRSGKPLTLRVAVAAGVLAASVAGTALFYSPGPPGYALTPQSLSIHDRFYPVTLQAANVDVDGIRVIDLDKDDDWRPASRTDGFANTQYASGHFRLANGRNVRMYRAGGKRLVLLPPRGGGDAVLLDNGDPAKLATEIRQEWKR